MKHKTKKQHYVWSVLKSTQRWLRVGVVESCQELTGRIPKPCGEIANILWNNETMCKEHYRTYRQVEMRNFDNETEGYMIRPELKKDRINRLKEEEIMAVVAEDENMMNTYNKDWIEELNELEKRGI